MCGADRMNIVNFFPSVSAIRQSMTAQLLNRQKLVFDNSHDENSLSFPLSQLVVEIGNCPKVRVDLRGVRKKSEMVLRNISKVSRCTLYAPRLERRHEM
jgi:hypothetical protein